MSSFSLGVVMVIVGVLLWAANSYVPLSNRNRTIMNFAVMIAVGLSLSGFFGVPSLSEGIQIGR